MSLKFKQIKLTTSGLSDIEWTKVAASERITDNTYKDSQLDVEPQLIKGQCYYFAGVIYKTKITQKIRIKLINGEKEQYIRTIEVAANPSGTVAYEEFNLMFTPLDNFSTIVFELVRTLSNAGDAVNVCTTELSLVQSDNQLKNPAIHMGIHAPAGTLLCINKQPIIIGKSGVLEINNGFLAINFLTVIAPRDLSNQDLKKVQNTSIITTKLGRVQINDTIIVDYTYEKEGV